MALKSFKKPSQIKQGLKIAIYGENGTGKSLIAMQFPNALLIDSESKSGTYLNRKGYSDNVVGVADTSDYYQTIDLMKEILDEKEKPCDTLIVDSETKIYESLSVSCMETEEKRALKQKKDPSDATVSMRGYGKIKLNTQRLSSLRSQASARGITYISICHVEDVFSGKGEDRVKIGEKMANRKGSEFDYDLIIKTMKQKDLGSGKLTYIAIIEKDTTGCFKLGEKIDYTWTGDVPVDMFYTRLKDRISTSSEGTKDSSYTSVDSVIKKAMDESASNDEIIEEFTKLFKEKGANEENKAKISQLLISNGIKSYKDEATIDKLKLVIEEMKTM